MGKKRKNSMSKLAGSGQIIDNLAKHDRTGNQQLKELVDNVKEINLKFANIKTANRAGFVSEVWHAKTLNERFLKNKLELRARLSVNGNPIKDIIVNNGPFEVAAAQVKYEYSAARSALKAAKPKYCVFFFKKLHTKFPIFIPLEKKQHI